MALNGKEKIWFLADLIKDERDITDDEEIGIKRTTLQRHYDNYDRDILFATLEKANAAKLIHLPTDQTWDRYLIRILPDFDKYIEKLEEDAEYLEYIGKAPKQNIPGSGMHSIVYTKSRQVLLDNFILLSQPNFNSENDLVFRFLYQYPNKTFSKKQLEEQLNTKIVKDLHKIVENLGFNSELAKAFFSVSKNDISFRNPVTKEELEQMGITIIRLNKPKNP